MVSISKVAVRPGGGADVALDGDEGFEEGLKTVGLGTIGEPVAEPWGALPRNAWRVHGIARGLGGLALVGEQQLAA